MKFLFLLTLAAALIWLAFALSDDAYERGKYDCNIWWIDQRVMSYEHDLKQFDGYGPQMEV